MPYSDYKGELKDAFWDLITKYQIGLRIPEYESSKQQIEDSSQRLLKVLGRNHKDFNNTEQ